MESLKELLTPKTFNKPSFVGVIFWNLLGATLLGIFADMENSESRFDFRCDATADAKLSDKDFTRGKCFDQYARQYNKLSIPVYGFVIVNVSVIGIVCVIYSRCVASTVDRVIEAKRNAQPNADAEGGIQHGILTGRRLFVAYCCQLAVRFALMMLFIVLQTQVLYPGGFSSNFPCNLGEDINNKKANLPANFTRTFINCHNQRATKKTFWVDAVAVVNGIFAFLVLIEIVCILSRARNEEREGSFTENSHFYSDHLKSSPDPVQEQQHEQPQQPPEQRREQNPQQILLPRLQGPQEEPDELQPPPETRREQSQVQTTIEKIKDDVIKNTNHPYDLEQPFRSNPAEGPKPKDMNIDEIYVNVVTHEGRADYEFPEERREQLKVYPKPANANRSQFKRPQDIIDEENKHVLVVGRPGIGKTMFSTKLLRMWASDDGFNEKENEENPFDVAFLVKFRRFNSDPNKLISLRQLLDQAQTVEQLDDEVWDHILENPTKVLLIFDGVDEFSARADISKDDSDYNNNVNEEMPVHFLYRKLVSGRLLSGATVITTSRPTAVPCLKHLHFDRTVEILGFTEEKVEEYVEKFTEGDQDAKDKKETMWKHINSNINIFSLCYIPVNCFIICHCLLHIIKNKIQNLPSRLTDIYSITVKIFFFKHNRNDKASSSNTDLDSYMFKRFDQLKPENETVFKKLGKIAFEGIKQGTLIFGSSEVEGLEDCGLLHRLPDAKSPSLSEPPRPQFCFMHLTLQEFFAAKHVTDTMNRKELREFVSNHIDEGVWQMVLQFVAGLLEPDPDGKEENSEIFSALLPTTTKQRAEHQLTRNMEEDSEPVELTCWPATKDDKELAVNLCKCIEEINVKQHTSVQNKLADIDFNAVDFSGCSLAPVDCAAVVNILKNATKITSMNLENNNIGSLGCVEVQKLMVNGNDESKTNCELKSLNLSHNDITHDGTKHLADALKNRNCKLNSLNISYNNITHEGAKHFADVLKNSNCKLNSLDLTRNNITNEGAKHFADALKDSNCKLNSLNLSFNNIPHEGAKHFADALKNSNCKLNSLYLTRNNITNEGAKHFADALKDTNCKLNSLNLWHNNITNEGSKHFADALKDSNCKLNSLDLSVNHITNEGAKHFADALKDSNCKLNSLNLTGNKITSEGAKDFADALKDSNCKLNSLNLTGNKITNEGAKHFADALKDSSCKLNSLDIAANNITNEGAKHFADALKDSSCKLNSLDLTYNNITDECKEHLRDALKHSNCELLI